MESLLTPKEVAKILKVGYRKVLDLIALDKLSAYRVEHTYRISEREVYRYLNSVKTDSHQRN